MCWGWGAAPPQSMTSKSHPVGVTGSQWHFKASHLASPDSWLKSSGSCPPPISPPHTGPALWETSQFIIHRSLLNEVA